MYHALFKSQNTHFRLTKKRVGILLVFYTIFPILELINWIGFLFDDIFFNRYQKQNVSQPVFILGNYRSGTTFLHRLLAMDKRSFTAMSGLEIFLAPSIIQRKIMRGLFDIDRFFGGYVFKLFNKFWDNNVQKHVNFHTMGVTEPEEDESLLVHIWSGIIPWNLFPVMDEGVPEYATFDSSLKDKEKKRIMNYYKKCLQRHLYYHSKDKRYLSKSPSFSGKVEALYETFPDAKIIYLIRNPMSMVPSQINMWSFKWNITCSPLDKYPYRDELIEMIQYWYKHPLESFENMPEDSYYILPFNDLIENPVQTVEDIYEHFNFELRPNYQRRLHRTVKRSQPIGQRKKGNYQLQEMGLSEKWIQREFNQILKKLKKKKQTSPKAS
jgi:hypothetical protein